MKVGFQDWRSSWLLFAAWQDVFVGRNCQNRCKWFHKWKQGILFIFFKIFSSRIKIATTIKSVIDLHGVLQTYRTHCNNCNTRLIYLISRTLITLNCCERETHFVFWNLWVFFSEKLQTQLHLAGFIPVELASTPTALYYWAASLEQKLRWHCGSSSSR